MFSWNYILADWPFNTTKVFYWPVVQLALILGDEVTVCDFQLVSDGATIHVLVRSICGEWLVNEHESGSTVVCLRRLWTARQFFVFNGWLFLPFYDFLHLKTLLPEWLSKAYISLIYTSITAALFPSHISSGTLDLYVNVYWPPSSIWNKYYLCISSANFYNRIERNYEIICLFHSSTLVNLPLVDSRGFAEVKCDLL